MMNPDFSLLGGLKRKSDSIIYVRAEKIAKIEKIEVEVRKEPRDSDPSDLPEGQREPSDPTEGPLEPPNDRKETIQERFERIRAISAANAAAAATAPPMPPLAPPPPPIEIRRKRPRNRNRNRKRFTIGKNLSTKKICGA